MADKYEYGEKHKTGTFRASFVQIFDRPRVDEQSGRKTWSVTAIFDSADDTKVFKKAYQDIAKQMWGDRAGERVKHKSFRSPFKDGADMVNREGEPYDGFEPGQVVIKLSSSAQSPGVVDKHARVIKDWNGTTRIDKTEDLWEEIEENEIYSGCYMRATFSALAYERSDGFGISFKVENLQKVKDGDRLGGGGRAKPEDDFEPVEGVSDDDFNDEELFG